MRTTKNRPKALALLSALLLGATLVTGCGDDDTAGPERGADVEEVQEDELLGDVDRWLGEKVTVSADVNEVINRNAFTIAGTPGSDADELLIVSADTADLNEGQTVQVTGTVRERFDVVGVADDLGVDWNDDLFTDWDDKHYIVASSVDTTVNEQGTPSPS
ncbi:hypothetical protein [Streptomyces viridochromogenes]|uniref:Lipoprotein n=1 Tax=Streptomyces viridochromogenes Tue57 TaxID=1160705 RepID=L8NZY1_STRVR|nr:hypothetical protein [Streptomyces viridochromogenes]ELS50861.1 hypothetical protein STVIR_8169 [Streptomyces viridochromogenes Tue57]